MKKTKKENERKRQMCLCLVNHSKDSSTCQIYRKKSLISQLLGDVFLCVGALRGVNSIRCVCSCFCV